MWRICPPWRRGPVGRWHTGLVFERFTNRARRVVVLAQEEARDSNHYLISTEHILVGLLREEQGLAAQVMREAGLSLGDVREKVSERVRAMPATAPARALPFTPQVKNVFELSLREALRLGQDFVGTEHLLLGLLEEGGGAVAVLSELGVKRHVLRQRVTQLETSGAEAAGAGSASRVASSQDVDERPVPDAQGGQSPARDAIRRRVDRMLKGLTKPS